MSVFVAFRLRFILFVTNNPLKVPTNRYSCHQHSCIWCRFTYCCRYPSVIEEAASLNRNQVTCVAVFMFSPALRTGSHLLQSFFLQYCRCTGSILEVLSVPRAPWRFEQNVYCSFWKHVLSNMHNFCFVPFVCAAMITIATHWLCPVRVSHMVFCRYHYLAIFFVVFGGYAAMGHFLFGTNIEGFSNIGRSAFDAHRVVKFAPFVWVVFAHVDTGRLLNVWKWPWGKLEFSLIWCRLPLESPYFISCHSFSLW